MLSIICVVQCRVVEYVLISKDNDDQIVTGAVTVNIAAESPRVRCSGWYTWYSCTHHSQNRIRVSAGMQPMLEEVEKVPTLSTSAFSLSTVGITKNISRHYHKQMFNNNLSTCTWYASPQRPSKASRIFAN